MLRSDPLGSKPIKAPKDRRLPPAGGLFLSVFLRYFLSRTGSANSLLYPATGIDSLSRTLALGSPLDEHNETKQNALQGLTTHSLACIRSERAVFAGLDLQVKPGRALLLSGANGSGKSSLLRVLAGLLPAAGGHIAWEGTDISEDPEAHRARVAYVGHADPLKPSMTASENLRFWAQLYGLEPDVEPALFQFSIEHLADVPARYFSAGQKRRLNLARLAAGQNSPAGPVLWLLDEPATGLDPGAVSMLANTILAHLSNEGVAIISTHGGRLDALLAEHADHVTMQTSQDGFPA